MNAVHSWRRWIACGVVATLFLGAACAADHSHVRLSVEVQANDTSASGDALGLYAAQLVPCDAAAASRSPHNDSATWRGFTERLLRLVIGTAHANHRERFDGPASGEFMKRVALDLAGITPVGEIVAPAARYCQVLLTLARLPAAAGATGSPELPFSLRLSTPKGREIKLDFRESLTLSFDKPWLANGRSANLVITLRPRSAAELIPESTDDFGAVSQHVVAQLAKASSAHITTQ